MALKFQSLFSRTVRSGSQKSERPVAIAGSEIPMAADDSYRNARFTPLAAMADAFEELSAVVKAKGLDHDLDLKTFCDACSLVVRQGLDLIRALFLNFLSSNDCCLKDAASSAYAKTCAPYHSWAVRTAAYAGMYALPTRDQLLLKLNETEDSAEKEMIRYINASLPVIEYIDKLYISRHINLDW